MILKNVKKIFFCLKNNSTLLKNIENNKNYDPTAFKKIKNSTELVLNLLKEEEEIFKGKKNKFKAYPIAITLIASSLFIYHLFSTCPFTAIFKHLTISEFFN